MVSRDVSESKIISCEFIDNLSALILICSGDSSPEAYRTLPHLLARPASACKSKVDFPMPGSPPMSTTEPETTPPPKTLSSSLIPVDVLCSDPLVIELKG